MPKTSAGKAVLGIASLIVGSVTGIPFFYTLGANMLLAGAAQELADDPRNPEDPPNPVKINFNGEEEPLFLVFGQHRVGGHISVLGVSGDENKYLHLGITHSAASPAGMSDITDIWLDENKLDDTIIDGSGDITSGDYAGIVNIRRYLGTDSETADSIFTAAIDYQDSSSFGKGLARTHLRLEKVEDDEAFRKAFPRGVPGITALLEGRCYDPRLDSTNGGTGTQDYADPDTWTFSQNPAVIAGTYLIMEKLDGGWGYDPSEINWTTLAAAANRCDEMVLRPDNAGNGVLVPRHTCNIILDTAEGIRSNLGKILSAMDGTAYTGLDGRVNIVAGQYDVPTTTIDETWVREGEIALNLDTDDDRLYNAVRAKYIEPLVGWQTVDCEPYTNSTYEADDGRQEWKDIQIPATIDRYEAQYLCKIAGRKSRHQRSVTLPLNYKGFDIEFWENVTLDLPDVSGVFKVIKWQFDISGPVVTLLEQTSTAWDDGVGIGDYTIVNPTPPASLVSQTPPTPTGLSATATADGIALAWDTLGAGEYAQVLVYRATSSGGSYSNVADVRGNWYTDPVTDGSTYFYKIQATSPIKGGTRSEFSTIVSATAKTVENGADVTINHSNSLDNPEFEAGDKGWGKENGWTIVNNPAQARSGSWCADLTHESAGDLVNNKTLQVQEGDRVVAQAFFKKTGGPGAFKMRIVWRDSAGAVISSAFGPDVSSASYQLSRANDLAPAGAVTAEIRPRYAGGDGVTDNGFCDGVFATIVEPGVRDAGSGVQTGDLRNISSAGTLSYGSVQSEVATTFNSDGTVDINSHFASLGDIKYSYSSVGSAVTGLTNGDSYWIAARDPSYAGGVQSWSSYGSAYDAHDASGAYLAGHGTVPADAGDPPNSGGGGAACVAVGSWLHPWQQAEQAKAGDMLDGSPNPRHRVRKAPKLISQPCVVLEADEFSLTLSASTPFTLKDGSSKNVLAMYGEEVLTRRYRFRWTPLLRLCHALRIPCSWYQVREWRRVTNISNAGMQDVMAIDVHDHSYAAGSDPFKAIVSHNMAKPL